MMGEESLLQSSAPKKASKLGCPPPSHRKKWISQSPRLDPEKQVITNMDQAGKGQIANEGRALYA